MSDGRKPRNILSIESAVADGSIAVICEGSNRVLNPKRQGGSRAETIIQVIIDVLEEGNMTLRDVDMIAISVGPGSYSGIRIGLSTALSLGSALDIPCVGVSVLEAMVYATLPRQNVLAAIPVGKNGVAWQPFEVEESGKPNSLAEPRLLSFLSFVDQLKALGDSTLLAQSDLSRRLCGLLPENTQYKDVGQGLAECVGRLASSKDQRANRLKPIYLRHRDVATGRARF